MVLSPERRESLLDKADLVLSATTHRFEAWVPEGFEEGDAVCVNTGAVNYPGPMAATLRRDSPHRIGGVVGQYIDLTQTERRLPRGRFAWIKPKRGRCVTWTSDYLPLMKLMGQSVNLSEPLEAIQIEEALSQLIKAKTGVNFALVGTRQGLEKGAVTREAVWRVFGKNTNIRIVNIPNGKSFARSWISAKN